MLPRPYLNANHYRSHVSANAYDHADVIRVEEDGSALVARSELTGRVWNGVVRTVSDAEELLKESRPYPDIVTDHGISDARFFPDGSKLVICDDGGEVTLFVRNPTWSWTVSRVAQHDDAVLCADVTPKGDRVVTGGADCSLRVWDAELTLVGDVRPAHAHLVTHVAVNPHQEHELLSSGLDGRVAAWDLRNMRTRARILDVKPYGCRCVAWTDETSFLAGYDNGDLVSMDMRQPNAAVASVNFPYAIHKIAFDPRSKRIAVCGDSETLSVMVAAGGDGIEIIHRDARHTQYVRGLCWDASERPALYSCGWDGKVFKHIVT